MSCAACAVCGVDAARLGAYANSYHGNSWGIHGQDGRIPDFKYLGSILNIEEGFSVFRRI